MTLSELLNKRNSNTIVRVFAGCMTLYNGNPSAISMGEWVKLHPYFNCKVLNKCRINNTLVITI